MQLNWYISTFYSPYLSFWNLRLAIKTLILEEAEVSQLDHSFFCFNLEVCDSIVCFCCGGLVVLIVSADFPGIMKYLWMLSVPLRLVPLMTLSAFTFLTLFGLTSTGLAGFALNWKMGKFKISLLASLVTICPGESYLPWSLGSGGSRLSVPKASTPQHYITFTTYRHYK